MLSPLDFLIADALQRQGGAGASSVPASAPPPGGTTPMSEVEKAAAAAAIPPAENPSDEIEVQNSPFHSRYKRSNGLLQTLFPDTFADGSTGGNILGNLKDAFLVQGGRAPVYGPRMQQLQEAEALQDYQSDPVNALRNLMPINSGAALKGFDDLADRNRQDADSESARKARGLGVDNIVRGRAASIIYAARDNPKAYPVALAQAKRYAEAYGVDTSDFPQDVASAQSWALGDVPVQAQVASEDTKAYRDAVTANQAARNAEAARFHRDTTASRNRSTDVREQHYNNADETASRNAGSNAERARKYKSGGSGGGGTTGASFKWDATKGKYVKT